MTVDPHAHRTLAVFIITAGIVFYSGGLAWLIGLLVAWGIVFWFDAVWPNRPWAVGGLIAGLVGSMAAVGLEVLYR